MKKIDPKLRSVLTLAATLFAVLLGFYQFVNYSADHQWRETLARRASSGKPVDWKEIIPAPVPDQQTFAGTPLLAALADPSQRSAITETAKNGSFQVNSVKELVREDPLNENDPGDIASYSTGRRSDLAKWQTYYQSSSFFPQAPKGSSPEITILTALDAYKNSLIALRKASLLPAGYFPVLYEEEFKGDIPLEHVVPAIRLANFLSLHATAALKARRPDEAWSDLHIIYKFNQALAREPILISNLVALNTYNISLNPIWEGLADRSWSPAELRKISDALAGIDMLRQFQFYMEGECLFTVSTLEYFKHHGIEKYWGGAEAPPIAVLFHFIPSGCYDTTKVTAVEILDNHTLPIVDPSAHRIYPEKIRDFRARIDSLSLWSPGNYLLEQIMPNVPDCVKQFSETQASLDMAHIACELELYYVRNRRYPDLLGELGKKLPHDVIDGQPYRYRRTADGRYELWSIGWNEIDDGATTVMDHNRADWNKGDWVWRYTPMALP